MSDVDVNVQADMFLKQAATRRAEVERLLGRSVWDGVLTTMLVLVIVSVLFLIGWSGWSQERPDSSILLAGALSSLLWVSLAVVRVTWRLHALATVLERSGVLNEFTGQSR